ncbi:MAG: ATP-binding cassette domain-containing protein [Candidatus Micrarchaeia archaeon]
MRKLTKKYSNITALDRVSFSVPLKGIFALIGRNCAGKTTLIRILSTELMPTSGNAFLDGIDIIKNPSAVREEIAVLHRNLEPYRGLLESRSI